MAARRDIAETATSGASAAILDSVDVSTPKRFRKSSTLVAGHQCRGGEFETLFRQADLLSQRRQARIASEQRRHFRRIQVLSGALRAACRHPLDGIDRPIFVAETGVDERFFIGSLIGGAFTPPAGTTNSASSNAVRVSIWGTRFDDNAALDVEAWGAKSVTADLAGTGNVVTVDLHGVSAQARSRPHDSVPDEVAGTNRATIDSK